MEDGGNLSFDLFHKAAKNGNIEIMKFLVKTAKEIEAGGEAGFVKKILEEDFFSVLSIARENAHIKILEFLVELAKEIEAGGKAGFVKNMNLHYNFVSAIGDNQIEIVKFFVKLAKEKEAGGETGYFEEMFGTSVWPSRVASNNVLRVIPIFLIENMIQYKIQKEVFIKNMFRCIPDDIELISDILENKMETSELIITVNSKNKNKKDLDQIKKDVEERKSELGLKEIKNIEFKASSDIIENEMVLRTMYKTDFVVEIKCDFKAIKDLKFKDEIITEEQDTIKEEIYTNFRKQNLDIDRARNRVINLLLVIFNGCNENILKNFIETWLPNTRDGLLNFDFKNNYPMLQAA